MAWGRKTEEPKPAASADPEIKPGDNKPEEKSIADVIAEAMKPFSDQITSMRADIDAIKTPPKAPSAAPEIPSVLDDENAAFAARLTPVLQMVWESEAKMAAADIEREYRAQGYGDLWDENRADINKELAGTPLARQDEKGQIVKHRGDPEFIRKVADMVIGRSVRKGLLKYDGKDKKFFLEDASGETSIIGRKPLDSDGLTKKQIEAAKRFGIPLADFKKAKDRLDFVS